jgi:hypothetical protein
MVHNNRKSHLLLPEMSPSAVDLPRANGSSPSNSSSTTQNVHTPTSMDMDLHMSSLTIDSQPSSQSTQQTTPRPSYPTRTSSATNISGLAFRQQSSSMPQIAPMASQAPLSMPQMTIQVPPGMPQMSAHSPLGQPPQMSSQTPSNTFYRPMPPQGPLPDLPRKQQQQSYYD